MAPKQNEQDRAEAGAVQEQPARRNGSTVEQLRADIDSGATRDKVPGSDPAAAPLGTDAEAGGGGPSADEVALARQREVQRSHADPAPSASGSGRGRSMVLWGLVALIALFVLALVAF
jgi:hypothetical protein